jgi:Spy/CpxP family protein refolding chaperone
MRSIPSHMRAIARFVPVALLALTFAAPALAQRGGGGGGGRGGGFGGGSPAQLTRLETLEAAFKLTKDEKKSVKTILDDAHKGAAPVRDALANAREAIAAAIQANKRQAEIDAAVSSYAEQAAAMTAVEMKALAQVVQALDPEQRANANGMRTAFFLMRGMFLDSKRWDSVPDQRSY